MRGRTIFFAVLAALSLLCGTAVAKKGHHHKVVHGSKHADHMKFGKANNRVFAGAGNDTVLGGAGRDRLRGGRGDDVLLGGAVRDRLRGGQDDDILDGGAGNDVINARGDGGDPDEVVCGPGEDTVLARQRTTGSWSRPARRTTSRDDRADDPETGDDPGDGRRSRRAGRGRRRRSAIEEPGDDDGCEHVKRPGGPEACGSHERSCEEGDQPGTSSAWRPTAPATSPVETEPEPDDPAVEPDSGSEKLY